MLYKSDTHWLTDSQGPYPIVSRIHNKQPDRATTSAYKCPHSQAYHEDFQHYERTLQAKKDTKVYADKLVRDMRTYIKQNCEHTAIWNIMGYSYNVANPDHGKKIFEQFGVYIIILIS